MFAPGGCSDKGPLNVAHGWTPGLGRPRQQAAAIACRIHGWVDTKVHLRCRSGQAQQVILEAVEVKGAAPSGDSGQWAQMFKEKKLCPRKMGNITKH